MKRLFLPPASRAPLLSLAVGGEGVVRVPMEPAAPDEDLLWHALGPGYCADSPDGEWGYSRLTSRNPRYEGKRRCPLQPGRVWVPERLRRYGREPATIQYAETYTGVPGRKLGWPCDAAGKALWVWPEKPQALSPARMPERLARLRLEVLEEGRPERWCEECEGSGDVPESMPLEGYSYVTMPCPDCGGLSPWWWVAKARRVEP